jgi:hypothetical protein
MEFIVGLMILAGVYFWVKKNYLQPETPQAIDTSPVRGVPLVKKGQNVPQDTDVAALKVEEKIAVVEPIQVSEVSIEAEAAIVEVAVESVVNESVVCQQIPEDSVLKRHYFAQLDAERLNLSNPYPTDSVLRRHHVSAMLASLNGSQNFESSVVFEQSINEPTQSIDVSLSTQCIPEDSVLKRHYHQLIQSQ